MSDGITDMYREFEYNRDRVKELEARFAELEKKLSELKDALFRIAVALPDGPTDALFRIAAALPDGPTDVDAAVKQIIALRKDKARLDWLDEHWYDAFVGKFDEGYLPWGKSADYIKDFREALDAVMEDDDVAV